MVPPKEDRVRPFLETIVKGWVKAYEESTAGPVFFKTMAPKQIMLVGSAGFNTDGTYVIGEAEQGNKITIYNINMNDPTAVSILDGNLRVFHHEFSHVLHHTQEYPEAFELISAGDYTSEWSSVARPNTVGFISSYAAMDPDEDFAEMVSWFIDRDSAGWEGHMIAGGNAEGSRKLREKESIMLNYMRNVWNIDLYQIRASVRRAKDEILGKTTTVEDSE